VLFNIANHIPIQSLWYAFTREGHNSPPIHSVKPFIIALKNSDSMRHDLKLKHPRGASTIPTLGYPRSEEPLIIRIQKPSDIIRHSVEQRRAPTLVAQYLLWIISYPVGKSLEYVVVDLIVGRGAVVLSGLAAFIFVIIIPRLRHQSFILSELVGFEPGGSLYSFVFGV